LKFRLMGHVVYFGDSFDHRTRHRMIERIDGIVVGGRNCTRAVLLPPTGPWCKVGFVDIVIGANLLIGEYLGIDRKNHFREKITDMVALQQTSLACAVVSAHMGFEEPPGSGVWMPDDLFGNIAKYNTAHGFWQIMKLAGDLAGGLAVTMPSEKELTNPETSAYVKKYLKARAPAEKRMRMTKVLQNWVAGLHGVGTWQGAGSLEAQRIMIRRLMDTAGYKKIAKIMAGIED